MSDQNVGFSLEDAMQKFEDFCAETGSNPETGELGAEALGAKEQLESEHFERKLKQGNRTEDLTRSQMTLLGSVLKGTKDNTERWQKVRRGFAISAGDPVPLEIWGVDFRELVGEIDAVYLGNRHTTRINGSSVGESYRKRVDSGIYNGAVGAFHQLINELVTFDKRQNEVDFDASVEFTRSAIVRRMQQEKWDEAGRLTRGGKPPEVVMAFEKQCDLEIHALMQGRSVDEMQLDDMTDFSKLQERMTEPSGEPIPTGLYPIDIAIGGGVIPNRSHRVHVIGASTGVGKTQICTMIAMGLVMNKCDVLFISVELTAEEMQARLLSNFSWQQQTPVPSWQMEKGRRDRQLPANFEPLKQRWLQMGADKERGEILLKYELDLGCAEIETAIQTAKDRNPNLGAVFVDHFHDMKPMDNRSKSWEDVGKRARELARIAKRYRVDMFVAAQLNRDAANVEEPREDHIADGSTLARVCHAMWTVAWYKNEDGTKDLKRRWLINAKKRTGAHKADGTTENKEKHEIYGDLDFCFMEHVG